MLLKLSRSRAAFDVLDPQTDRERRSIARKCNQKLNLEFPTLVDSIDDAVNRAYAAWPTRLYLLNESGEVIYAGGLGPFGFKPAELEQAISTYLADDVSPGS